MILSRGINFYQFMRLLQKEFEIPNDECIFFPSFFLFYVAVCNFSLHILFFFSFSFYFSIFLLLLPFIMFLFYSIYLLYIFFFSNNVLQRKRLFDEAIIGEKHACMSLTHSVTHGSMFEKLKIE